MSTYPPFAQAKASIGMRYFLRTVFCLSWVLILSGSIWTTTLRAGAQDVPADSAKQTTSDPAPSSAGLESAALPDDPSSMMPRRPISAESLNGEIATSEVEPVQGQQTRRILFLVPNFRSVSADARLQPQSKGEKLKTATLDSLDYSSFLFYGIQSGISFVNHSYPEFQQGAKGYGRYYWHTMLDSTDENYWVEFVVPVVMHQDTRYYTLGRGPVGERFLYSFSRAFITRTDRGNETLNVSEIAGAGISSTIANLYYPEQERTFIKTYQRWVTNVVIDGGTFVFKEFWPDLNNRFFHQTD